MASRCEAHVNGNLYTGINAKHIFLTSRSKSTLVCGYSHTRLLWELMPSPMKVAYIGYVKIHISLYIYDGMLKHKGTYEIISPEDIGLERTNEVGIVLGKLSFLDLCKSSWYKHTGYI
ncbi:hypothetical protein GLYMA_17G159702v4 [Glycine max]|nr:hypothetical protein GLYMA_17G159702v4 [Glycine max]KAH1118666.1 hypothetical protein GYH30_047441 [Glycine max]